MKFKAFCLLALCASAALLAGCVSGPQKPPPIDKEADYTPLPPVNTRDAEKELKRVEDFERHQ